MDFINQLINIVKSSPNPEIYYLGAAIALIVAFYLVNKILKIITFCLIIGVLAFGLSIMQGKDSGEIIASIKATFDNISGSSSSTNNGSYITGTKSQPSSSSDDSQSGSSGGIQELISNIMSKFSGGQ